MTKSVRAAVLRAADGSGDDTVLSPTAPSVLEAVMAPNGTTMLGRFLPDEGQHLPWWTRNDSTLHRLVEDVTDPVLTGARFSPDGRWVAYHAGEINADHVYVTPFPGPGAQTRIDRAGGGMPVWGPDGKTVYYFTTCPGA